MPPRWRVRPRVAQDRGCQRRRPLAGPPLRLRLGLPDDGPSIAEPPPFAGALIFTRKDAATAHHALPALAGAPAGRPVSESRGLQPRVHDAHRAGPAPAHVSSERRAGQLRAAARGMGGAPRRASRPHHRALPARAAPCGPRRRVTRKSRRAATRSWPSLPVPGQTGGRLPERVSHRVVRPSGEAAARLGALLHLPQDPCGRARHVRSCRQQAGPGSRQRHGGLGGQWSASKPEARCRISCAVEFGGMSEIVLQSSPPLTNDDPLGEGRRQVRQKDFLTPLAQRRDELRGPSHEYARAAGDRRGAALSS